MNARFAPLAALTALALGAPAAAQCPSLELRFYTPGVPGNVLALAVHDDGAGARLVAGGQLATIGGESVNHVAAWDGERWSALGQGFDDIVRALVEHDLGAGPVLVAGGSFQSAGGAPASGVALWDGAGWSAVGAGLDGSVEALCVHDFGAGPRLVATGTFLASGATPLARVAFFDGASWVPLGAGLDGPGFALASFDDGTGAGLVVGGDFTQAGGVACANLARFDGTSWSPLGGGTDGTVRALVVRTAAGADQLFAGGEFAAAGGAPIELVARFDGSVWSALGTGLTGFGVHALAFDGADLLAGGTIDAVQGSENVARFDGTSWLGYDAGLGNPLFDSLEAFARFDPEDGGGSRLFAGGRFDTPGGGLGTLAQWDGARWSALRDVHAQGMNATAADDGPQSGTMWQGELVLVGEFAGAGEVLARGAIRWDGTTWSPLAPPPVLSSPDGALVVRTLDLGAGPELLLGMMRFGSVSDVSVPAYRWNGVAWVPLAAGATPEGDTRVASLVLFDDGAGERLWAAGYKLRADAASPAEVAVRWNGSAWERPGGAGSPALDVLAYGLHVHDSGAGPELWLHGTFPGGVRRWDGAQWAALGAGLGGAVTALATFDDGSGPRLYASGTFLEMQGIARWNGASWEAVPGVDGSFVGMTSLCVFDDGSGAGALLYGQTFIDDFVVFDGLTWTRLAHTEPYFTFARLIAAEDLPGGPGIVLAGDFREIEGVPQAGLAIWRGCAPVRSFCTGDGLDPELAVACPCANEGLEGHGCAWRASGAGTAGALLEWTGSPAGDDLTLLASSMPASGTCLFFQGAQSPAGVLFGDGVLCTTGSVVRLGARVNVGGAAELPSGNEPALSALGGVTSGSGAQRSYQVWFRAVQSFCTPAPFNVSNGLRVTW